MVVVVDFGSQTTHLIARRIGEWGVLAKIVLPKALPSFLHKTKVQGIILSGGPASVYEKNALSFASSIFKKSIPILGICYGLQLTTHLLGGKVTRGKKQEFGPAKLTITHSSSLFKNTPPLFTVWMSHGDEVVTAPKGFVILARTDTIPHAAIANKKQNVFGIQFHPEVVHTQFGDQILKNFLKICGLKPQKQAISRSYIKKIVLDIKESVGSEKAICALSGGVDSSVAAVLTHKALDTNLTPIYIDSGLMRKDETKLLSQTFRKYLKMKVWIINAKKDFLKKLSKVVDPEEKRKIIGNTFIEVLEKQAKKMGAKFLIQGTIYPDVIESAGTKHSKKIKTHHNVAGLPKKMHLILIEPLRNFYKDEVRKIAKFLKLPDEITQRQPFPGPGLAVRIVGSVTDKKLQMVRKADAILQEEMKKAGLTNNVWQAFAVHTGIQTTGVRGDNRAYGNTIALRVIQAKDAMSAHWVHLPYKLLNTISSRIVNEIKEVNRVVYDVTNKPPATMEWE